jgi:CRISPR-associated protein (TIGR02710 family)
VTDAPRPLHLFLTVGGSPSPLRSAMAALAPQRLSFVVSDGSNRTTSSRGEVCDERLFSDKGEDRGPGLRFHPACPPDFSVIEIPPDDPDRGFALLRAAILAAAADARVVADYTGGSKSMSTALFLAASSVEGVAVQFMRGQRTDLRQVADGTERPWTPPIQLIGVARRFDLAEAFARQRDYGAAHAICLRLCEEIGPRTGALPADLADWGRRAQTGRAWFEMLDAWDRFAFKQATTCLQRLMRPEMLGPDHPALAPLCPRLAALRASGEDPSFALVEDLWLNAQRRADPGRWDDAVARLYRLAEAALQAWLWRSHGLKSGRVPVARVPESLAAAFAAAHPAGWARGTLKLGLTDSARLLRALGGEGAAAGAAVVGDEGEPVGLGWQDKRNGSILAHGFDALSERHWTEARAWFDARRRTLWEAGLGRATAAQLPQRWPV